ncbi:MAG: DUF6320 domain-containing protein [Eubacteriaceae bacterium]
MAYCPKCGVEVENKIEKCPLCEFPIPDIGEGEEVGNKYPKAINTYSEDHLGKKNKAFFTIGIIALSMLVILFVIALVYPWNHQIILYIGIGDLCIFSIVFFSMGYLKPKYNFLGVYLTLIIGSFCIYISGNNEGGWFFDFALPIATLAYIDVTIFRLIFRHNRHRSQFIYIPSNLILFAIVLSLGMDGIISYHFLGILQLTWSLIVAASGGCIIILLQVIYHRIPEKTRKMLKKKMHV